MSESRLFSLISHCIESDENYKKDSEEILQGVSKSQKNYVTAVLKIVSETIRGSEEDMKPKFLALKLVKDCMELGQGMFIIAVAEGDILPLLESYITTFPKFDAEIQQQYGSKPNIDNAKKFYILMMEFIKYYGEAFKNEKEPLQRFPALYEKLLSKRAKFPPTYSFLISKKSNTDATKSTAKTSSQNNISDTKDSKSTKKDEAKNQKISIIEALSRFYDDILQQPFFYNAQELEEDNEVLTEQILDDEILDPQYASMRYNAQTLENDEGEVIEEDEREYENSLAKSGYMGDRAQLSHARLDSGGSTTQKPVESKPKSNAYLEEGRGGFEQTSGVPPIKGFIEKKGQPVLNQSAMQRGYSNPEDKGSNLRESFGRKSEEKRGQDSINSAGSPKNSQIPTPKREAIVATSEGSKTTKNGGDQQHFFATAGAAIANTGKAVVSKSHPKFNAGSLQDFDSEEERPSSQKGNQTTKKYNSLVLKNNPQIDESPEFRVGTQEEEDDTRKSDLATSQNRSHNIVPPVRKDQPAISSAFAQERSDDFEEYYEITEQQQKEKRGHQTPEIRIYKGVQQSPNTRASNLEEDYDTEQERQKREQAIKKPVKTVSLNAGSLKDLDDTEKSRNLRAKAGSLISDDASFRNKSQREELEEIAARINRSKDIGSYSDINISRRAEEKSMTDFGSVNKREKVLGESLLNGVNDKKGKANTLSPDNRRGLVQQNILPHEYTSLENYFEREIGYLKGKNETLTKDNQELLVKNATLETRLAQEIEKNRELKEQLSKKDTEIQTALQTTRARLDNYISPKRGKETTPLSSPKSEVFRKKAVVKTPKQERHNVQEYRSNFMKPVPPPQQRQLPEVRSMTSLGPFLRRNLEGDSEFANTSIERSNAMFLKTMTHSTIPAAEYISPKSTTEKFIRLQQQPASALQTTRRPFQSHHDLPFATNMRTLKVCCVRDTEILYENAQIMVGMSTIIQDQNAQPTIDVNMVYTNKTPSIMNEFSVTYKSAPGFLISAENMDVDQRLEAKESQIHQLRVEMISPTDQIGSLVIEYRINEEPIQIKLHLPTVLSKFLKFSPITSTEFIRKRKTMQNQHPENSEESPKVKLSHEYLLVLNQYLFSKMTPIETEASLNNRFILYGGHIQLEELNREMLVRCILEKDSQLLMIQVNYDEECREYAANLMRIFLFICNEKMYL